jgi:tRNA U34 2-thiouridine synthase MnmA/TrmU
MTPRAVALFSGGLDSALAILTILKQDIEVKALAFLTPFNTTIAGTSLYANNDVSVSKEFGFDFQAIRLTETFIDIVKNPRFGYGKNMNPCIDCRILMLREAKNIMHETCADFIITGEVLGQRPMSQRKATFSLIDREAGVRGHVLRPLSARLLEITIPESKGIVNREKLHDFSGRTRRPLMTLANEWGLSHYPSPAGGCLLTEPHYAQRLKDVLHYQSDPGIQEINMLKIGRHFRFSPACKIIVGRDKKENDILESFARDSDYLITIEGYGSPITIVSGEITNEALRIAASLCARYSDAREITNVEAKVATPENSYRTKVLRANNEIVESLRIDGLKTKNRVKA